MTAAFLFASIASNLLWKLIILNFCSLRTVNIAKLSPLKTANIAMDFEIFLFYNQFNSILFFSYAKNDFIIIWQETNCILIYCFILFSSLKLLIA